MDLMPGTAMTASPFLNFFARPPAPITSPAHSLPRTMGNLLPATILSIPFLVFQSTGFTLAAWTLMSTSSGPGEG
jgi:hypothetical protein